MPCSQKDPTPEEEKRYYDRIYKEKYMPCTGPTPAEELRYYSKINNDLTQFLCYVLRSIEPSQRHQILKLNPSLREWWLEHEKIDRMNRIAETKTKQQKQLRENAIKKLTQEERIALGLNMDI